VSVHDGNTNDPKTLMPQVDKVKKDFGIQTLVLAGDRGMISQKAIDELKE
jgi:transposase